MWLSGFLFISTSQAVKSKKRLSNFSVRILFHQLRNKLDSCFLRKLLLRSEIFGAANNVFKRFQAFTRILQYANYHHENMNLRRIIYIDQQQSRNPTLRFPINVRRIGHRPWLQTPLCVWVIWVLASGRISVHR